VSTQRDNITLGNLHPTQTEELGNEVARFSRVVVTLRCESFVFTSRFSLDAEFWNESRGLLTALRKRGRTKTHTSKV
jgi:hypothetical protein